MASSILRAAYLSGSLASVTSTLALALGGEAEADSASGPINGPSQWLWGQEEAYTKRASWRHTAIGYAIHHAMSILWASFYERACQSDEPKSAVRICTEAASVASLAYVVDYHVAPARLRPGFKKHLGPRSIFAAYAAFAVGLALATMVRQSHTQAERRRTPSASLAETQDARASMPLPRSS